MHILFDYVLIKGLDTIKASNYIFPFPYIYICITIFWELWAYLLIGSSLTFIITKFQKLLLTTKVYNTFPKLWIQIFFLKNHNGVKIEEISHEIAV